MAVTGQPSIDMIFKEQAVTAIQRSEKGVVALLIKDSKLNGPKHLTSVNDIPKEYSKENQEQITRAFRGNTTPPRKVIVYSFDGEKLKLEDALNHFDTEAFDYLAPYAEIEPAEVEKVASWVKTQRQQSHRVKTVLPDCKANHEGIVNITSTGIWEADGEKSKEVSTEAFCARMAGLIAGTSMLYSATYSVLNDVVDVDRLTKEERDEAAKNGEFIIFHDGQKIKTGRAVNSFTTPTAEKGEAFQKIKTVEVMDMLFTDIHTTISDHYIGKFNNSYDNKCLVITAIKGYLLGLEAEGILERDKSVVEIDLEQQRIYLESQGTDTSEMSEQDLKQANTGSFVFLSIQGKILDAMEDFVIAMYI